MLPRASRISRKTFPFHKELKKHWGGAVLGVRCYGWKDEASGGTRVAIIVGKRSSKSAVVRNRLKRQLASLLEKRLAALSFDKCVFSIKPAATTPTLQQMREDVIKFFNEQ